MYFTDGVDKPKLVASLLQVRITSAGSEVGWGGRGNVLARWRCSSSPLKERKKELRLGRE